MLDLGCGTGLNSRHFAGEGFMSIGVDLALSALEQARRDARLFELPAYYCLGDVSDLSFIHVHATLILDIGCFHNLDIEQRQRYRESLADHLLPQGHYLLYAFARVEEADPGASGIGPGDIGRFAPQLTLEWSQHGSEGDMRSAWYLLRRSGCPGSDR